MINLHEIDMLDIINQKPPKNKRWNLETLREELGVTRKTVSDILRKFEDPDKKILKFPWAVTKPKTIDGRINKLVKLTAEGSWHNKLLQHGFTDGYMYSKKD